MNQVVSKLRTQTVPDGYHYHTWKSDRSICIPSSAKANSGIWIFPGKTETETEMLLSILAQLEYAYQVCTWDEKGVPFSTHMYVPEIHPSKSEIQLSLQFL